MASLIILPPIITALLLVLRGFTWTFIYWWIPLMLLVPTYFEYDGPGIPPMTFYLIGFVPFLFCRQLWTAALRDRHWLDLLVFGFVFVIAWAELVTTGFSSGRQLFLLNSLIFLGPYLAMKYIVFHEKGEIMVAKSFVIIMALIALYNLYTFRFGYNHFLWLRNFWPYFYESSNIVVIPRWGFFRAQGPFVHPIAAGIAYGFALPMTFWLVRYKKIKPTWLALSVLALCSMGLIMTISRGPYLGAIVSSGLYLAGQSKYRMQLFALAGLMIFFLSVPLTLKVSEYFSLSRATARTDTQETVLYRKELIFNYVDIIFEEPYNGYGFLNIPYVGDQKSIDNAYLLYALSWGLGAVLIMLALCLGSLLALFILGIYKKIEDINRGIVWALIGGIAGCAFSMTTVHLARPISTILFMWIGWAAALLLRRKRGWMKPDPEEEIRPSAEAMAQAQPRMVIL